MKIKFVKANRALNVSTSAMFLALGVLFPLLFHAVRLGSPVFAHAPARFARRHDMRTFERTDRGFFGALYFKPCQRHAARLPHGGGNGFRACRIRICCGSAHVRLFGKPKQNPQKSEYRAVAACRHDSGTLRIRSGHVDSDRNSRAAYTFAVFIGAVLLDSWAGCAYCELLAVPAVMYVLKSAHIL